MAVGKFSNDPRVIYLAPKCCYTDGEGRAYAREWCEDNAWPCADCPDPANARVAMYRLAEQIDGPVSDDLPENAST